MEIGVFEPFLPLLHHPNRLPYALTHDHDRLGSEFRDFPVENGGALFHFLLGQAIPTARRSSTNVGIANLIQVHQIPGFGRVVLFGRDTAGVENVPKAIRRMGISMASCCCHEPRIQADHDECQPGPDAIHKVVDWAVWVLRGSLFRRTAFLLWP